MRRRFFESLSYAPEARVALDLIRDVYVVEHDAKAAGIARTDGHAKLRRARSRPAMDRLHAWLVERKDHYAPKSPMAGAVRYALNNWTALFVFVLAVIYIVLSARKRPGREEIVEPGASDGDWDEGAAADAESESESEGSSTKADAEEKKDAGASGGGGVKKEPESAEKS